MLFLCVFLRLENSTFMVVTFCVYLYSVWKIYTDIILLGDFNLQPDAMIFQPLTNKGYISIANSKYLSEQSANYSYLKGRYKATIDQIMLSHDAMDKWLINSTTILKVSNKNRSFSDYLRSVSDHAPVWASFVTSSRQ